MEHYELTYSLLGSGHCIYLRTESISISMGMAESLITAMSDMSHCVAQYKHAYSLPAS